MSLLFICVILLGKYQLKQLQNCKTPNSISIIVVIFYTPAPPEVGYTVLPLSILPSVCPSIRPKIFFDAFFSATIDGRNLISGHKLHIGTPYRGKRFWTRHIPTSCLQGYHK